MPQFVDVYQNGVSVFSVRMDCSEFYLNGVSNNNNKKKVFLFKTILAIIVVGFPFILFSICFNIMYKICLTSMGLPGKIKNKCNHIRKD